MRFNHPDLAKALAHLFDSACVVEKIAVPVGNAPSKSTTYEPVDLELSGPLRARYEGVPVSSVSASKMFDTEAVAVDKVLLNQAVPIRNGMFVTLQKDGDTETKRFYVQDASVTEAGFTMLSVLPRRPKAS